MRYSIIIALSLWLISGKEFLRFTKPLMERFDQSTMAEDKVIFEETFEGATPFSSAHALEIGPEYALMYVRAPVYQGNRAARFELRLSDQLVKKGKRTEATIVKNDVQKEMWYSFAVYFPTEDFEYDSTGEILSQWKQAPDEGEQGGSPATALRIKKDRFILDTGFNSDASAGNVVYKESRKKIDLGQVTKDTWHEFVFHIIHSHESDGLIEVWHNGKKILLHNSGNMYNNAVMPKWKIGIYKYSFKYNISDVNKRVVYFDNIKVGRKGSTYKDMRPRNITANAPTPAKLSELRVLGFTLVDATTERDIMDLRNGAVVNLKKLNTKKVNIRANTTPPSVGSVGLSLVGTHNQSRFDNSSPYALFGDDRNGNYYSWTIKGGQYKLHAIPYQGAEGSGQKGKSASIEFVVEH